MSNFYNPRRKPDWNYGGAKWKLSRSKIDLFMECPRCFYLDNKFGVARPKGPSFTLNVAVDALLKKEFDIHRADKTAHPLMKEYGIDAVPFQSEQMETWRDNFKGVQYLHEKTGFLITGAIDDIWVNPKRELMVVDYKATSKEGKIESLDDTKWQKQYRRQMEIYQWLLKNNGFKVSETGYFVYVNGKKDKEAFDAKLEFDVTIIPHKGDTGWIDSELLKIKKTLDAENIPPKSSDCDFCSYIDGIRNVLQENASKKTDKSKKVSAHSKTKKDETKGSTLFDKI